MRVVFAVVSGVLACAAAEAQTPPSLDAIEIAEPDVFTGTATFDPALAAAPALLEAARADAEARLTERADEARAAAADGVLGVGPWALDIGWGAAFIGADAASASASRFAFSGGAHPNVILQSLVWDLEADRPVSIGELFSDPADGGPAMTALSEALTAAYQTERAARGADPAAIDPIWLERLGPRAENFETFIIDADETGAAQGLTFLFSAYRLGAYVDGAFVLAAPSDAFAPHLTERWARVFAPAEEAAGGGGGEGGFVVRFRTDYRYEADEPGVFSGYVEIAADAFEIVALRDYLRARWEPAVERRRDEALSFYADFVARDEAELFGAETYGVSWTLSYADPRIASAQGLLLDGTAQGVLQAQPLGVIIARDDGRRLALRDLFADQSESSPGLAALYDGVIASWRAAEEPEIATDAAWAADVRAAAPMSWDIFENAVLVAGADGGVAGVRVAFSRERLLPHPDVMPAFEIPAARFAEFVAPEWAAMFDAP